jgi:LysM repeat protein
MSGDSLSKIAERYKTSTDEIAKNNNIKDVSKIFPGQNLTIYGANTNSPSIYIVLPGDTLAKIAEKMVPMLTILRDRIIYQTLIKYILDNQFL